MSTSPPRRRWRKRVLLPLLLGVVLLLVGAGAWVRGSWASTTPHNPTTASERAQVQLFQTPEGDIQVRTALVVEQPIRRVWDKLTDYDHFEELFPTLHQATIQGQRDGAKLSGMADSPLGQWPVELQIKHVVETPQKYVAAWDSPHGDILKNKGSFTLTPLAADKTLLVYALEIELARYPAFIVRNILLSRQQKLGNRLAEQFREQK